MGGALANAFGSADRVYVSVTTTKGSPGQPELGPVVGEQMLAWLRGIDGFEGLLMLDDDGSGTTLTLTFWRDSDVADRHWAARMQFRDRVTAAVNVNVEGTVDYDVSFVHLGPASRK
jgi:hypothetical protein